MTGSQAAAVTPFLPSFPEPVQAIRALAERGRPLVSICGAGTRGSRPSCRANEMPARQGGEPVDWQLP